MRVSRALKHAVPSARDRLYQPGDQVLVWRERQVNNRIGEWVWTFRSRVCGRIEEASVRQRRQGLAMRVLLMWLKSSHIYPPEDIAHAFVESLRERFCEYGNLDDDLGSVYLTEIINGKDPRSQSPEITAAKRAEIAGLTCPRDL